MRIRNGTINVSKIERKGRLTMQNEKLLEILRRIELILELDCLYEAKKYIQIEIENLKGITQKNCKSKFYFCEDYYCKTCHNLNCENCTNGLKELKI